MLCNLDDFSASPKGMASSYKPANVLKAVASNEKMDQKLKTEYLGVMTAATIASLGLLSPGSKQEVYETFTKQLNAPAPVCNIYPTL